MSDFARYSERLIRLQLDRLVFEVNEQLTGNHVEELVLLFVVVPMKIPLHDTQSNHAIIHFRKEFG
jgi:hypothetical protein